MDVAQAGPKNLRRSWERWKHMGTPRGKNMFMFFNMFCESFDLFLDRTYLLVIARSKW